MWYFLMALPICMTTLLDTGYSSGRSSTDNVAARIAIIGDSTVANYKAEEPWIRRMFVSRILP
jgi:hypothetical protein